MGKRKKGWVSFVNTLVPEPFSLEMQHYSNLEVSSAAAAAAKVNSFLTAIAIPVFNGDICSV